MKRLRLLFIGIGMAGLAYFVLFHTRIVINRVDTLDEWTARFLRIESGNYDESGFIFYTNENALMDQYVEGMKSEQSNLLFGIGGDAFIKARSDRLAWRSGRTLFLTNLAPLSGLPNDFEYDRWKKGIASYLNDDEVNSNNANRILFAFAALYFEEIVFINTYSDDNTRDKTLKVRNE